MSSIIRSDGAFSFRIRDMRENEKEEVAVDDMVRRSVGEAKLGGGREEVVEEVV